MYNIKENIIVTLLLVVNMIIAFTITNFFGISNITLYKSLTAMNWVITYEVIIWFILMFVETGIYEIAQKKSEV